MKTKILSFSFLFVLLAFAGAFAQNQTKYRVEVLLNGTQIGNFEDVLRTNFMTVVQNKQGKKRQMPVSFLNDRLIELTNGLSTDEGSFFYSASAIEKATLIIANDKSGKQIRPIKFGNEENEGIFLYHRWGKTKIDPKNRMVIQVKCLDSKNNLIRTFVIQLTDDQNYSVEAFGENSDRIPLRAEIKREGRTIQLSF